MVHMVGGEGLYGLGEGLIWFGRGWKINIDPALESTLNPTI